MAIQIGCSFKGFSVPAAYIEITDLGLHKHLPGNQINYVVWKDSTKQERLENAFLSAPYDAEMSVPQAYAYMKTLPEFADAVDV